MITFHVFRLWYVGLTYMLRGIRKQMSLVDRSMLWLKELYIQLYYENGSCEPLASDSIKVIQFKFKLQQVVSSFCFIRLLEEQIILSCQLQHRHQIQFKISRKIWPNNLANFHPNNQHLHFRRVEWRRRDLWLTCSTVINHNNHRHRLKIYRYNIWNKINWPSHLKIFITNNNRTLHPFVILLHQTSTSSLQNNLAHLTTYHLTLI